MVLSPCVAHTATLVWPPLPTGMHHDERYFKDPHAFKPERWVDDVEAVLEPAAWMPFGAGPRRCPGERLAGGPTASIYFTYSVAGIGLLSTTVWAVLRAHSEAAPLSACPFCLQFKRG